MSNVIFNLGSLAPQVEAAAKKFQTSKTIERIWERDHSVWRTEEVHKKSILNRLGWLKSVELMKKNVGELLRFAGQVRSDGFTHAVVLGMGGSSLCPDVCRATFGSAPGFPRLLVLDSTNPLSVARIEQSISLEKTLFLVASKSGGTTETNMFYRYFYDQVGRIKGASAGDNFVAITDAETQMEKEAKEKRFRKIFVNPTDIGGRYSALSYFGLVPMAVIGMDLTRILDSASSMMTKCSLIDLSKNTAAMIGIAMGEGYKAGKDKLTFIASKGIETFSYWTEQLIAESTGKEGKGIVPIEGETLGRAYSTDRMFVTLKLEKEKNPTDSLLPKLHEQGHPIIEIVLEDANELGGEFFRWEFSTAVAAAVMQINPFDEPNVKESKDNTVRVIEEYKKTKALPSQAAAAQKGDLQLYGETPYVKKLTAVAKGASFEALFKAHLGQVVKGDYAAVLAYVDQNEKNLGLLQQLRSSIGSSTKCATTLGFGPRYLHSTGQLHKGGPPRGVFIIITGDEPVDRKIPNEMFSFEVLKNAQAIGDYQSLAGRSLRVIRIHLGNNIDSGLTQLISIIR